MKTDKMKLVTTNLALAAALALLASCVSKSYEKGAATATALQSAADAVSQTTTSVTGVLAALNKLTFKSEGDLRKQYDAFVSATEKLAKSNENLAAKATAVRDAAAAHAENWTNQMAAIQSDELRKRSTERMNEVTAKLKEMDASYLGVKNSLRPFMADLKDIQTYLGTDLTAGGLATIKDVVSKTKVDAVPLRESIKQLQASFSSLGAALSPVLPEPEKK
ncbi:MAG: DUF2959 family protein [Verrucomicrobiales bacterium]|nr:DUF2959 family protein [Verrucomicrobiales bacterium]